MDPAQDPMPDFTAEDTFLLCDALMATFGWDKACAIQHLEDTWQQAHPECAPQHDPPILPQQEQQKGEQALA